MTITNVYVHVFRPRDLDVFEIARTKKPVSARRTKQDPDSEDNLTLRKLPDALTCLVS